jgi:hypothetical protein
MRVAAKQIHASSHPKLNWTSIKWKKVKKKVQELQMRIAKAVLLTERLGHLYTEVGF